MDYSLEDRDSNLGQYRRDDDIILWPENYEYASTPVPKKVQETAVALPDSEPDFKLGLMEFVVMASVFLNLILIVLVLDLGIIIVTKELKKPKAEVQQARMNNEA